MKEIIGVILMVLGFTIFRISKRPVEKRSPDTWLGSLCVSGLHQLNRFWPALTFWTKN